MKIKESRRNVARIRTEINKRKKQTGVTTEKS
jgi:ribosomal protein L29